MKKLVTCFCLVVFHFSVFSQNSIPITDDLENLKTEFGIFFFNKSVAKIINKDFTNMSDSLVDYCGLSTKQLVALKSLGSYPTETVVTFGPIDGWLYGYTFYSMIEKLIYQIEARDLVLMEDGSIYYKGTTEKEGESYQLLKLTRNEFKEITW